MSVIWFKVNKQSYPINLKRKLDQIKVCGLLFQIRTIRVFEDFISCKECGNRLGIKYRKNHDYWTGNCNKYARDPRRHYCTPHFFPYEYLEEQLLSNIKEGISNFFKMLDIDKLNSDIQKNMNDKKDTREELLKNKKQELENNLIKMYEDKLNGVLSSSMYITM